MIFVILVASVISLNLYDTRGDRAASKLLDRISFWILAGSYLAINILIPITAKL